MKIKLKRVFSAFLSAAVLTCTLPVSVITTSAEETVSYQRDAQSITKVQGGAILHCWNWSFDQIKDRLSEIAAAGYTAVQTSPIQPPVDYSSEWTDTRGQWWKLYQPLDFAIPTEEGHSWLGTKSQLTQLCSEAESQYGIKVIVDVVANHLANNGDTDGVDGMSNAEEDTLSTQAAQVWQDNFSTYFHQNDHTHTNGNGDRYNTTQCQMGMPDLNTGNEYVQQRVLDFLKECVDCGVDGFRFDAAKHIELPDESDSTHGIFGSDFWPTVINGVTDYAQSKYDNELYIYSEILGNAGSGIDYTQYMAVTDNETGNNALYNVRNNDAAGLASSHYYKGSEIEKYVLWAESHDTYNELAFKGYGTVPTDREIVNTWAIVGARADSTALYFSRHNEIMGQASSDDTWKSTAVAEVNKFKKIFDGQGEYLSSLGNTAYIERGTKGVVISKLDGAGSVRLNAAKMEDGEYTDHVTNTTFTVSGGVISGTVDSSGVAVIYNADDITDTTVTSMPTKLYLDTGGSALWDKDGARFGMQLKDAGGNKRFVQMLDNDGDSIYEASVPPGSWTKVTFYRIQSTGAIAASNYWNNTGEKSIEMNGNDMMKVTDWWVGQWSRYQHTHQFTGQPTWTWSDNHSSAYAVFSNCTECGKSYAAVATVTSSTADDITTYTATVTYNGQDYTDTQQVAYEPLTLYLDTGGSSLWNQAGARFAMDFYNDDLVHSWVDMTLLDGDIYSGVVPAGNWTKVIFCRMKSGTTENNNDNRWNRTASLAIPDANGNTLYTVTGWTNGDGGYSGGNWSTYTAPEHTHTYGSPSWTWAADHSTATAVFTCTDNNCGESVTATDSAPETDYISTIRTHTASVTGPDGEEYSCTAYEPMVVQIPSYGSIMYQFTDTEKLAKLYQCVVNQTSFTSGVAIDISACNILVKDWDSAVYTLLDIFPEINFVDVTQEESISISSNGEYLTGLVFNYYTMTKEQFDTKLEAFDTKADEYLSLLNDDMDDFTKALVLHDRLVLDHYYQQENSSNYTFMLDGWGRCENYTEVYAYLLARVGIKSEIVSSSSMEHEWMMLCLDGKYYHVDVTWDDPYSTAPIAVNNISNRADKVRRTFFLLSDTLIQDSSYNSKTHNYYNNYNEATDVSYDSYTNLHGNDNLICYANGALYTLYENNAHKGVIAIYNPVDDTYTDKYVIDDRWAAAGGGYWTGNFSSIAECNGLLYFNGEHTINIYDPATGSVQTYYTYNAGQLYGMYIQDGQIYGLTAPNPNSSATGVFLTPVQARTYTVRWVNYDGSELEKDENVTEGTMPSYDGAEPTKPSDAQYDYTFSGWTPDVTAVTGNITYTANYTPSLRKYTVVWQDYDNTLLETDINVPYGTTPTYDSETPSREGYTFKGWNPSVTTVTGNAVYTAEYDIIPTGIFITEYNFAKWDKVYIYYWGGTSSIAWPGVEMTPADEDNFKFTYTIPSDAEKIIFDNGDGKPKTANLSLTNGTEWSVSLTSTTVNANPYPTYYLTGSMNNWALNDTSYTFVPNMNENGFEEYVLTTELSANDAVKVFGGTNYYPSGGEASNYTVAADGTYRIYFRRNSDGYNDWHGNTLNVINVTPYTVAFSDGVDSQTVTYGNCAAEPAQPSKENYTFKGWYLDGELYDFSTPVTSDITLTAQWKERTVNIQFIDVNGKVKTTLTITPIDNSFANVPIPEIPSAPHLDGYTFTGWTVGQNSYSDAGELTTALESLVATEPEDAIIVREVYTQAETRYTVTVINGTVRNSQNDTSGSYKASDQIYVTATGGTEEQAFSYWTKQDEGVITPITVGYEETYAFRMPSKNTTLSAVYDGAKPKVGTAYIESVTKTGEAAISFAAVFSVPEGATMRRAGIVACMSGDLNDTHTAPSMEYARFRRYNDTTCVGAKTFKYTWTKSNITTENDTWCVCAYLLYEKDGIEYPVYSNMASAKLTDFS